MLQVLVNVSLEKFQLQKKGMSYARVIHKNREEKVLKNWSSVRDIKNNGYLDARLKNKKER
jgi:hypothetical protein